MAVTNVHCIKSTLDKAISYICNPEKTDGGILVSSYACTELTAYYDFFNTRDEFSSNSKNIARHLIQSFSAGEVTAEQAHEIGIRLADELLKGEYEYIIATHIDGKHIHNHIIFNETNFVNGKAFGTEHDKGKKNPAWKQIRTISDRLCMEYNLSVIQNAEHGCGKCYYEWEQSKKKASWKDKLRDNIDECIMSAESFEDFLSLMQERNYEYKLTQKGLAFKAAEQERFTNCRRNTLGWYYEPEQLRLRIERSVRRRNAPVQNRSGFVQVTNPNADNIGLQRWAMYKNVQELAELINQLTEYGCGSPENLKEKIMSEHEKRQSTVCDIKSLEKEIRDKNYMLKNIKTYWKMKPINDKYKSAIFNKSGYYKAHEGEIRMFQNAKSELKKTFTGTSLPSVEAIEAELKELETEKDNLSKKYDGIIENIKSMEKVLSKLEAFNDMEIEKLDRNKSGELD